MTAVSPRPQADSTMVDGASEAEAARVEGLKPAGGDEVGRGGSGESGEDAAEAAGTKRRAGERDEDNAPPGAVPWENVTTETDDGVS